MSKARYGDRYPGSGAVLEGSHHDDIGRLLATQDEMTRQEIMRSMGVLELSRDYELPKVMQSEYRWSHSDGEGGWAEGYPKLKDFLATGIRYIPEEEAKRQRSAKKQLAEIRRAQRVKPAQDKARQMQLHLVAKLIVVRDDRRPDRVDQFVDKEAAFAYEVSPARELTVYRVPFEGRGYGTPVEVRMYPSSWWADLACEGYLATTSRRTAERLAAGETLSGDEMEMEFVRLVPAGS